MRSCTSGSSVSRHGKNARPPVAAASFRIICSPRVDTPATPPTPIAKTVEALDWTAFNASSYDRVLFSS